MFDEHGDVRGSITQRRQGDLQDVEAIVEVLSKSPRLDLRSEIPNGRGDHADVDLLRFRVSDLSDLLFLQNPEELDLQAQRQLTNLVEEERATVRLLKEPVVGAGRVGEGPANVTEELAFEEVLRDRSAVHRDEGPSLSNADVVQRAGDELLAGPALSVQENGRLEVGDLADHREDLLHGGRVGDEPTEPPTGRRGGLDLGLKTAKLLDAPQPKEHLFKAGALLDEVHGPALQGVEGRVEIRVRGHEHEVDGDAPGGQRVEQLYAGKLGHDEVAEHDVEGALKDGRERGFPVFGRADLIPGAPQVQLHRQANVHLVVDDEHSTVGHGASIRPDTTAGTWAAALLGSSRDATHARPV